jgi:[acyl-carrier-protein] S-malonyltransferase
MRLAFLFPGQGAQKVAMGNALAEQFSVARATFEEADQALGEPLSRLCFEGPEAELTLTANAQPAILTASIAAYRVVQQELAPPPATALCGHSLGEWSALVAAGALSLSDAVRAVRARGRFMQEAVAPGVGAMAAVLGLEADVVSAVCKEATVGAESVEPANFNGGGQVVIAGHAPAVARATELAKGRGAKRVVPLPVSAPFHCSLMGPAAVQLAGVLERVRIEPLRVPVVSNVEAQPNLQVAAVKELLVRQVTSPVRFEECGRQLAGMGVDRAIECGPGTVLAGLMRRISPDLRVASVGEPAGLESARALLGCV